MLCYADKQRLEGIKQVNEVLKKMADDFQIQFGEMI